MCSREKKLSRRTFKSLLKTYPFATYNSLLGTAMIYKHLVVLQNHNIIIRRDYKEIKGQVKIIGGGAAGIEPAESCYVGKGMLTAAVIGETFIAPSANEILIAIRELAVESADEILLLVKNYTGDRLNFGLALEKAVSEDINVKMLLIGDNVTEINPEKQGRKGLAGSVLVYKIAGEMAEEGKTADEIIEECREYVLTDLVTVSAVLAPCSGDFCDSLIHYIGNEEMVLGMGIYGQKGIKKIEINSLVEAVAAAAEELWNGLKENFETAQNIVLLVNNLGGMSKLEESIICKEISYLMQQHTMSIVRIYAGTFMSSLNTQGFSITVLKINSECTMKYLNASTSAPAWPGCTYDLESSSALVETISPDHQHDELNKLRLEKIPLGPIISEKAVAALNQIVIFAAEALISCERQLNIIDSEAGDGDAGEMLKKGAEAIKTAVSSNELEMSRPCRFLYQLSEICCSSMGGLTGALYSVFFSCAAKVFENCEEITPSLCFSAFKSAVRGIKRYGKAEIGDRTMLDALCPAIETFESAVKNEKDLTQTMYLVAATCEYKAEETKFLKPLWLKDVNLNKPLMYADAGAHAAGIWLRAVSEGLKLKYPSEC